MPSYTHFRYIAYEVPTATSIPLPNDATRVPMKGNPYYEFEQRLVIYPPQPLP